MKAHALNFSIPKLSQLNSLQLFQVLRAVALFVASVAVAQVVADKAIIGQYETLLLLGSSLSYFWVSGIINAFIPHYHQRTEAEQKKLIYNVFLLLSALSVAIFIIIIIVASSIYRLPGGLYIPFAFFTLFNAPAFLAEYILLVKNKPKSILVLGLSYSVLYLGAIALPLYSGYSISVSLEALAVLGFLKFIVLLILTARYGTWQYSGLMIRQFARLASPLVLSLVIGGSMLYVDSYTVQYFFDDADFAIFQYGARELPFVLLMANALSNVYSGEIARADTNGGMEDVFIRLRQTGGRLMHLLFPLSLGVLIFAEEIYDFFYKGNFQAAAPIFSVYLLLIISRMLFPQTLLLGLGENKTLLRISIWEWIINFILNLVFLCMFDMNMIGIAYATVVAYAFEKAAQAIYLRKKGIRLFDYSPARIWLFYSLLLLAVFVAVASYKS